MSNFVQALQDRMAELDLVGSPKVRQAVRDYFDALQPISLQIAARAQQYDSRVTAREAAGEIADIFRSMDPHRERVLEAMRQDLGFK